VFTSNVDGQFQAAGFDDDRIVECHGSIHHLQCAARCSDDIWRNQVVDVVVDESTMRAAAPLPTCPRCGGVARPNVLMFGYDQRWVETRADEQTNRYRAWMRDIADDKRAVIIECGAGTAVPSVRQNSNHFANKTAATLVRINPREPDVPPGAAHIGLAMSSLDALRAIHTIGAR
jgi:NAD-dependent SIR2 family protein deacetylase